ncbi:hypothetical protein UAJ10_09820 [Nitrospirillum sp. BR 11164]|uniref:hypothetical protein n=1 Tax=Nitrospirillum sp. BR 11164 TaxID=3104324 RepID=UPI002AFEA15A|nr:hypothetical protein [Nitrospirillum sp. BR 11164]MEA1649315.1 hypothetical protein [Nitrospirillum sp. BR 11164]
MTVLEVAVYALVLTGGKTPFFCEQKDEGIPQGAVAQVECTNGLSATEEKGVIHYDNGVAVFRLPDGSLSFSNGITAHWGAGSWVQFSNGVSMRRVAGGNFRSSTGMLCEAGGATKASCHKDAE